MSEWREIAGDQNMRIAAKMLEQQGEIIKLKERVAELEQQLADVGQWTGRHVINLREDGFTIMHPLSCRPNLFDCIYNYEARQISAGTYEPGRYYCDIGEDGIIIQEPA